MWAATPIRLSVRLGVAAHTTIIDTCTDANKIETEQHLKRIAPPPPYSLNNSCDLAENLFVGALGGSI
jgi:hypothetical protein